MYEVPNTYLIYKAGIFLESSNCMSKMDTKLTLIVGEKELVADKKQLNGLPKWIMTWLDLLTLHLMHSHSS